MLFWKEVGWRNSQIDFVVTEILALIHAYYITVNIINCWTAGIKVAMLHSSGVWQWIKQGNGWLIIPGCIQCFDTVFWVTGHTSVLWRTCATYPSRFCSGISGERNLRKLANSGSPGKRLLKCRVLLLIERIHSIQMRLANLFARYHDMLHFSNCE